MKLTRATALGSLALTLTFASVLDGRSQDGVTLDPAMHHLGDDATPEWPEASEQPEGGSLAFGFDARRNEGEHVLAATARHVDNDWTMSINGTPIGLVRKGADLKESFYVVPAGVLVDGANRFELRGSTPSDDITFGRVRLIPESFRDAFDLRPLAVEVVDGADGSPLPARVTVADRAGSLVPVFYAEGLHAAARDGVVYTARGRATLELPAGEYRVYATRGSEWGVDQADVRLDDDQTAVRLSITREVDTRGWVAADTHIHTLTFSGHGDSSVEERMVTLAGEGVELAIATDHNHNTDYLPYQQRMELNPWFTPVVGNEVTTEIGHFNAFPLDPADEVPPYKLTDVAELVDGMRAKGARVVILNHPRWPSHEKGPFGAIGLDHFTGDTAVPTPFPMDAVELINSTTEESEPLLLFRDWFALLNRGERLSAVGSSDSHTVGKPVGGGRTYVQSETDDAAAIDVERACANIVAGRSSISMGIFCTGDARVEGVEPTFGMGAFVAARDGACTLGVRIQAPSWVRPRRATLFLNGAPIAEYPLDGRDAQEAGPFDLRIEHELEDTTGQDAWAVWVIEGDGVDGPFWPLDNDYTLGATNPIFLDFSGDGSYESPRATALELWESCDGDELTLATELRRSHEGVAFHLMELARAQFEREARAKLEALAGTADSVHARLRDYLDARAKR